MSNSFKSSSSLVYRSRNLLNEELQLDRPLKHPDALFWPRLVLLQLSDASEEEAMKKRSRTGNEGWIPLASVEPSALVHAIHPPNPCAVQGF